MRYPLIVVETPHRLPVRAYVCRDESHFAAACEANGGDNWPWLDNPTDEDRLAALGHDFATCEVFQSAEEVRAWLNSEQYHHQLSRRRAVVRDLATELGWLDSDPETDHPA